MLFEQRLKVRVGKKREIVIVVIRDTPTGGIYKSLSPFIDIKQREKNNVSKNVAVIIIINHH
uniref:Uncharacterized protein n=1 Tax=Romanomermis culicivorax TaxID=13658 RepID=A0A915K642_ROMCU